MEKFGIIIRADATPEMGTGHVMRCLALAQAAQSRGIPVTIIGHIGVPWVQQRLALEGINVVNLEGPAPVLEDPTNLLQQLQPENRVAVPWVVLDGYHFGLDCQQAVRNAGYKLLVIDDYAHLPEYSCDILLNQNFGSDSLKYPGNIGVKLLGPEYALLRQEFVKARKSIENILSGGKPQNILVSLGGGNFSEHLTKLAPCFELAELGGCSLRVVAGAMPDKQIKEVLQNCPATLEILHGINDMSALLLDTDLCVTAGGSTCWELCCLGVPFLTIEVAENQKRMIESLDLQELAPRFTLDRFLCRLQSQVPTLAVRLMSLADGTGACKVLGSLEGKQFFLRDVRESDKEFVWNLASAPEVRRLSKSTEEISWDEHCHWFSKMFESENPFFIACNPGAEPIAYIRFACLDNKFLVSIALADEYRGRGIGEKILEEACRRLWSSIPDALLEAHIMEGNTASEKIFKGNQFRCVGRKMECQRIFSVWQASNPGNNLC